jgi:membrane protease YdiL (CAAX protease family)
MLPIERLRIVLVWIVILGVAAAAVSLQKMRQGGDESDAAGKQTHPEDRLTPVSVPNELLGKVTVAMHAFAPQLGSEKILETAKPLREGEIADQLGYSVLVGVVEGWDAGAKAARAIEIPADAPRAAAELRDDLASTMERHDALAAGEKSVELQDAIARAEPALGFFARALGESGASEGTALVGVLLVVVVWYVGVFAVGLVALGVLAFMLARGRIKPRLQLPQHAHPSIVLGETFAIWIVVFLSLSVVSSVVGKSLLPSAGTAPHLLVSVVATFASLSVLAYPRLRGVPVSELRALIGLHTGQGVIKEIAQGFVCYVSAVPLLAIGLVVFAALSALSEALFGKSASPSHPIVEMFHGASRLDVVMLFMLASVAAPIVEEIAFRGLLYGHLRGVVAPRIRLASAAVAAIGSSFIFAVIHPQGVLFVPALGGLAVGFCIYREVRGSLIPSMVAHGVNNAVTLLVGLTLLS